jgi:hypothetical protein
MADAIAVDPGTPSISNARARFYAWQAINSIRNDG